MDGVSPCSAGGRRIAASAAVAATPRLPRIDVGGLAVTIGARISARAKDSEVLVSQTVKDLVPGSGLTFEDAGEHELKCVPDRWHLYRVVD